MEVVEDIAPNTDHHAVRLRWRSGPEAEQQKRGKKRKQRRRSGRDTSYRLAMTMRVGKATGQG